jgi:hypothetical protein
MNQKRGGGQKRQVEHYQHADKERLNSPPAGLVTPETDPEPGEHRRIAVKIVGDRGSESLPVLDLPA